MSEVITEWPRRSGKSGLIAAVRQYNELVTDPSKRIHIVGAGSELMTGEIGTFKGMTIHISSERLIEDTHREFSLCLVPRSPQQKGPPTKGKKGKIKRW